MQGPRYERTAPAQRTDKLQGDEGKENIDDRSTGHVAADEGPEGRADRNDWHCCEPISHDCRREVL